VIEGIDISMLGDKALARKLKRLEQKDAKKVVRDALKSEAKIVKRDVIAKVRSSAQSGPPSVHRYREAIGKSKVKDLRSRSLIGYAMWFPDRATLGIDPKDKHFFPAAFEYGHGSVPAVPIFRPSIDEAKERRLSRITKSIRRNMERMAAR